MSDRDATTQPRSRRAVLGAAAAGAIGLTAGRLAAASPASAASGAMQYGDDNDAGADETTLTSTNPFRTLKVTGSGAYAVAGEGTGAESTGVVGIGSGPGTGVRGVSPSGVGLTGESETGHGLKVDGRSGFSTAGWVSVPKDRRTVIVTAPWIKASSLVLATIQRDRPDVWVRGVVVSDGSFRIFLNRRVAYSTKVAYFVFEQVAPFPD
jgi:hypothetical protein